MPADQVPGLAGVPDRVRARVASAVAHARRYDRAPVGAPEHGSARLDARTRLEDAIEALAADGKAIRPRTAYLGRIAVSGDRPLTDADREDLDRLGAALELLHIFGMLQDDVMDASDRRRGRPSAHTAMADEFTAQPRPGSAASADRFGQSLAVLAGDLAFALAGRELRGLPDAVLDAWDATVLELVHGQRLDLVYSEGGQFDCSVARWVAMAKSGAYTIARPLELGARLADPTSEPPEWLQRYGREVAMAFALADDILGVWGDQASTGKPVGDDLRLAKPTIVLAHADRLSGGRVGARLAEGPPDDAAVEELLAMFDRYRVREAVQADLVAHLRAAETALADAPTSAVRSELAALALTVSDRRS